MTAHLGYKLVTYIMTVTATPRFLQDTKIRVATTGMNVWSQTPAHYMLLLLLVCVSLPLAVVSAGIGFCAWAPVRRGVHLVAYEFDF